MVKDKFDRHTIPRKAGYSWSKVAVDNSMFVNIYKASHVSYINVYYYYHRVRLHLLSLPLAFCVSCGRFRGFGSEMDVCWLCTDEFDDTDGLEDS
jgi:hypothetical protein